MLILVKQVRAGVFTSDHSILFTVVTMGLEVWGNYVHVVCISTAKEKSDRFVTENLPTFGDKKTKA